MSPDAAEAAAKPLPVTGGAASIVVPGTWVNVPLSDPETTRTFVRRLVLRQMGRNDRLAKARREAQQELLASVDDALRIGVHSYLMSLELLPGVPFGAAMLMRDESWSERAGVPRSVDEVRAALATDFPGLEVVQHRSGPMARGVEAARTAVGSEDLTVLRLEYHIPYPDRGRLLSVRVNVPAVPGPQPFAALFDEIVDSIRFADVADGAGPGRPDAPSPDGQV